MAIIEYEGADISAQVVVSRCVWDAREEGRVPHLTIEFDDAKGLWDSWAPKPGDRIAVSAQGAPATGAMFVKSCAPIVGGYELRADALPIADASAVRLWRSTTLYVTVAQLAATLGLTAQFHGCDDMQFAYVRQEGDGALPVIARLCAMAGCTFDVYDGGLHVCSRDWIAAQSSAGDLDVPASSDYEYRSRRPYTSCSITQTAIPGERAGLSASYGVAGRTLAIALDERVGLSNSAALERACAGLLACANARLAGGHVKSEGLSPFSPGSVCSVTCARAPSLNGSAVVTRVRNDFATNTSKTWWRQL